MFLPEIFDEKLRVYYIEIRIKPMSIAEFYFSSIPIDLSLLLRVELTYQKYKESSKSHKMHGFNSNLYLISPEVTHQVFPVCQK